MSITVYEFDKLCDPGRLTSEITASGIIIAIDHIETVSSPEKTKVFFKNELSTEDETTLDGLVDAHVNTPLPEDVTPAVVVNSLPDPIAFAQPTYRTKHHAVTDVIDCVEDATTEIDFVLPEELYVYGGEVLALNAKFGDYISAEVYDKDSVIPEPYRATLCEAWPSVAKYIVKRFFSSCSSDASRIALDTRPLSARVTAGLYLRVTYHATTETGTRKAVVNYFTAKKLV